MIPNFARGRTLSHGALALALALAGATGLAAAPAMAKEQPAAQQFSPGFRAAAGPLQKDLQDAVKAANPAAIAGLKPKLDAAVSAAQTPDDKYLAGQFVLQAGGVAKDSAMQRQGLELMLASGKTPAADAPKFSFYVGSFAFDAKDYPTAQKYLTTAVSGGYHDNDADALLAESYLQQNQTQQGLQVLMQAIKAKRTAGQVPPQTWYRRGLGVAYKAKMLDQAAAYSNALVEAYPTTENWAGAISVVRMVGNYQPQDALDLMRLMDRTKSFSDRNDYMEYISAADARRAPGEVLKIIDEGKAAGKLDMTDSFVAESQRLASGRIAADKASLPGIEASARAGSASAVVASAAGDAFLSYADAAKAEAIYGIALTKPGVDQGRVLTRLGIAQVDQGKYADAQATFAKVQGARKPIAELWSIYAAQKAKGG